MASLVKYFAVKLYHAIERYVIKRRSMLRSTMARKRLLVEVEERLNRIKINGKLNGLDDTELSNLVTFHLTNKIDTPDEWNIWLRILPFVTFITIVAAMIFQHCIPCQRYSYMMGRKLLFQLSPYWDWESVYYTRCLVSKPMFWKMDDKEWPQTKLNMIECDYCDDVTQFELLTNNSKKEENANIANRMAFNIANKIPFVYNDSSLKDEIRLWPIHTFDNVVHWKKLMDELEFVTNLRHFCMFKSSIGSVHNPVQLLTQLTDDYKPEKWFAHWENCGIDMMKTIRKLYVRPSVLPPMVELSKPNWILLSQDSSSSSSSSKNYSNVTKVQKYKQVRLLKCKTIKR